MSNWIIVLGMSFILKKFSFKHNHSKNIWDKVWFSCKIVPYGKSSISTFWQFLASIEKIYILALRLALYYHSSKLYLKSFGKSYTPLLLIIALRFNCGERKIWQNIKKSQNIISMIVWKFSFDFYVFINSCSCEKQSYLD